MDPNNITAAVLNASKIFEKYCVEYYTTTTCSKGPSCSYKHKLPGEVEVVIRMMNPRLRDCFIGKIPLDGTATTLQGTNKTPCRFYETGQCIYQNRCKFSHDNDNEISANNNNNNNNECEDVVPSTSNNQQQCNNEENNEIIEEEEEEEEAAAAAIINVANMNWVNAPEFKPGTSSSKTYAEAVNPDEENAISSIDNNVKFCSYTSKYGICFNLSACKFMHGDLCSLCERFVLHPYNEAERKKHQHECIERHEKRKELTFAIQRSKEKSCGVCFEVIMEKAIGEQRFGILPNCNHCFCLSCIRKWRQARQFENKIIRACPQCRVTSDYVCPSMYWVDTKEDKEKLIEDYKKALSCKHCKYFKLGEGKCPFGNKCFYKHATPDGVTIDVGPPPRQPRRRNPTSEMVLLWDYLDDGEVAWDTFADDLESYFGESDDSDWSDYELFAD